MSQFHAPGARIVHESDLVTEYDDGTEEVRFTAAEWEVMLSDPRFGYILACGHPASAAMSDGSCGACEAAMSAIEHADAIAGSAASIDALPQSPAVSEADDIPF